VRASTWRLAAALTVVVAFLVAGGFALHPGAKPAGGPAPASAPSGPPTSTPSLGPLGLPNGSGCPSASAPGRFGPPQLARKPRRGDAPARPVPARPSCPGS
jgi:hypothetical protein